MGNSVVNERMFVGRDDELAKIMSCVEAAGGGRAQVVWIEGEAGSGKTAVVRRVLDGLAGGVLCSAGGGR